MWETEGFFLPFSTCSSGRTADGTYVNKRLLELDVKSVIGKGDDGVLSTAHILCALSMQFKERNLQGEEKPFRALSSNAKSLNTGQVNRLHTLAPDSTQMGMGPEEDGCTPTRFKTPSYSHLRLKKKWHRHDHLSGKVFLTEMFSSIHFYHVCGLGKKYISLICIPICSALLQSTGSATLLLWCLILVSQSEVAWNYLKILILPDQLLPGKDLIGLDALKAVPGLFILEKTQMFK